MDAKKVGKTISFLRKYYGMTQKELADRLGVTDKAVSKWEQGRGVPDISLLAKISVVLDTDIESILEGNLTHLELNWKGIISMEYSHEINADASFFGIRSVYLQTSFLMLAGIKEICIRGIEHDIDIARRELGDGSAYGLQIAYENTDALNIIDTLNSEFFKKSQNDGYGVMIINGLDFLYGKDVTKYFRRVIYGSKYPVRLVNFKRRPTSIYFFPDTIETAKCLEGNITKHIRAQVLERGVITFPIKTLDDSLDASMMIRVLEKHQEESVSNLSEIAVRRGFVI